MTIGSVGPIDPIQPGKDGNKVGRVEKKVSSDSISISAEALKKADFLKAYEIVSTTPAPSVREDRIAEIKAKINDPAYITETVLYGTADHIMDVLWPNAGDNPFSK